MYVQENAIRGKAITFPALKQVNKSVKKKTTTTVLGIKYF